MTHWSFDEDTDDKTIKELKALSTNTPILLIADGDIKSKANRVVKLQAELGNKFYMLQGKEIENLIPDSIVKLASKKIFS